MAIAAVVGAVALLFLIPGVAASEEVHVNVSTGEAVEAAGSINVQGAGGLLVSSWGEDPDIELSADRVHVSMTLERGQRVDGRLTGYSQVEERRTSHRNLTSVEATIDPWGPSGTIFTEPSEDGGAEISSRYMGSASLFPRAEGAEIAKGGYAATAADSGGEDIPSYAYRSDRPLLENEGLRSAEVSGSFTLFVHNVTIDAQTEGEDWRNWTGYQEEGAVGPYSRYELRVTVLHVERGHLRVNNEAGVSLLGPRLDVDVDGSVAFSQADGLLDVSSQEVLLRGIPLELSGSGSLSAVATGADAANDARLAVEGRGSFDVLSPENRLEGSSTSANSIPGAGAPWLSGLLVASVAVATVGTAAYRRPRTLRPLPVGLRDRLFWRWMRKGQDEEEERAFGPAARFYRRSTAIRPSKPMGWYHRTKARLDAGEPRQALDVIDQAADQLEAVPLDLVELEVAAAWSSGEGKRAKQALLELGERAPAMARGLVEDLGLESLKADADVREALSEEPEPGGLEGYV